MDEIKLDYKTQNEIFINRFDRNRYRDVFQKNRNIFMKIGNSDDDWAMLKEIDGGQCLYQLFGIRKEKLNVFAERMNELDEENKLCNSKLNIVLSIIHMFCNGTPGIARTMYLAGKMVNDIESIDIGIKAIEGLCNMKDNDWMLDSPTICHGYAGLLTVIQAMYLDTNNPIFDMGRKRLLKIILSFYSNDAKFVFPNIDYDHPYSEKSKLVEKDDISLLEGTSGVLLSLLPFFKPITTNWMRHFLIN